jgi:hypothetical protein
MPNDIALSSRRITSGPHHHFFGYIGHAGTIPWNASGRHIVALRTTFQDRMPGPDDPADVILLDTRDNYRVIPVEQSRAWNPQQGTMLYWNPQAAESQFFFNDRDPKTGKVFAVLYDIAQKQRVREYRFDDTPVGNSGVAQKGGAFLAINYARLDRLRKVTGYGGAWDWTVGVNAPENDGIFKIDVATGRKQLLVSFGQLRDVLRPEHADVDAKALFINHTLWNRDDDRIYFYCRGDFDTPRRLSVPFTIKPDGSGLTRQAHLGGHPEWDLGRRLIGGNGVLYDVDQRQAVGQIAGYPRGDPDVALSPDGKWLAIGDKVAGNPQENQYTVIRRSDGAQARLGGFSRGPWKGDLRVDGAPCWNRDGTQLLLTAIADDEQKTRQMFIISVKR